MAMIQTLDTYRERRVRDLLTAYDQSMLTKARARQLEKRRGELQKGIAELIAQLSVPDQYAREKVDSVFNYPREYEGPKPIGYQIKTLAKSFGLNPGLALKLAKNLPELPRGAEGWFAFPSVEALDNTHFIKEADPALRYCRAVQLVCGKIAESRPFLNPYLRSILPDYLRIHARTADAQNQIAQTQKGDILIVACQLGRRHRGKSARRAREVFADNEFGLGLVAMGSIILTHPKRLVRWSELDIDCAGDEFSLLADNDFSHALVLQSNDKEVMVWAKYQGTANGAYGSATGFLPFSRPAPVLDELFAEINNR